MRKHGFSIAAAVLVVLVAGIGYTTTWSGAARAGSPVRTAKTHAFLTAISFANAQDGWVAGHSVSHGYIFHTANSGTTWSKSTLGFDAQQMQFIDANHGWAVVETPARCGAGISPPSNKKCLWAIDGTTDGGKNWSLQLNGGACWQIQSLDFITANEGWAIESNSPCVSASKPLQTRIMETTNAGGAWSKQFQPSQRLTSVHFGSSSNGWAAGDGLTGGTASHCKTTVYDKSSRGQTWGQQLFVSGYCSGSVDFVDARHGWLLVTNTGACSMNGCYDNRLYRTTNGGNNWVVEQKTASGKPLWSGSCGFPQQPHFTSASVGYMPVGAGPSCPTGGVDITRDGGHHWVRKQPQGFQITDISPVSASNVWAIGCAERTQDCSHLVHTSNSGQSWAKSRVD